MSVGRTVSTVMNGLQESFQNLAQGMGALLNIDWQQSTQDIAESLVKLTETFNEASGAIKTVGGMSNAVGTVFGDGLAGRVHRGVATDAEKARFEAQQQSREERRTFVNDNMGSGW